MNYKANLRKLTLKTLEDLAEIEGKIKALEADKQNYYKPTFDELMRKLNAEKEAIISSGKNQAEELLSLYEDQVKEAYRPKGSEMTDDVKVLEAFELTEREVKEMFDRYEGNVTMQRLVAQYARKNGFSLPNGGSPEVMEAGFLDKGKSLHTYFLSALTTPEYGEVFKNDANFATISAGIME